MVIDSDASALPGKWCLFQGQSAIIKGQWRSGRNRAISLSLNQKKPSPKSKIKVVVVVVVFF